MNLTPTADDYDETYGEGPQEPRREVEWPALIDPTLIREGVES